MASHTKAKYVVNSLIECNTSAKSLIIIYSTLNTLPPSLHALLAPVNNCMCIQAKYILYAHLYARLRDWERERVLLKYTRLSGSLQSVITLIDQVRFAIIVNNNGNDY